MTNRTPRPVAKESKKGKGPAKKPRAGSTPSPTMRRQQRERRERMKLIREQVADGTLVIRKMTAKERRENPPQPQPKKR
jgi:hypothetical protein